LRTIGIKIIKIVRKVYIEKSEDLKDILLSYDILLFDIYGVLWNGKSEIMEAIETATFLRNIGKKVVLVSNMPSRSEVVENGYFSGTGLRKGCVYDVMITSGDVLLDTLLGSSDIFSTSKRLENCYVLGKLGQENFAQRVGCRLVNSPKEADFVYLGFPQLSLKEIEGLDGKYKGPVFESDMYKERYFDVTDIGVFSKKIASCRKYDLPMLSDCADPMAPQADRSTGEINYVLRQGALANRYREMGGQVVEICKPNSAIYAYAFRKLKEIFNYSDASLQNSKILMIGDTLDTDVLGANNATRDLGLEVDSMLLLSGVSGKILDKNPETVLKLCSDRKLNLNYLASSLSLGEHL
jgi:ribonucleotide monophosphatase NagD (HAD superfamily)